MDNKKSLILIDGHALAYRMFFALERTGMKTSKQEPTWAIYGFVKALIDILKKHKPDALIVSFDVGRRTFRTEEFEEYKANRQAMPDTLREQMQSIIDAVKTFDIPVYTKEGFEADDIIGTIVTKAKTQGFKSYILTGDQDSFQLIDEENTIEVLIPSKGELVEYTKDKVFEKLGVYPHQIIDYKALRGDTADNIPGVKGIGEKTAAKLLATYQNLDNIYTHIEEIKPEHIKQKLINDKEMAYKSKYLATIIKNVDLEFDFENAKLNKPSPAAIREFFTRFEFYGFLKQFDNIMALFNNNAAEIKEQPSLFNTLMEPIKEEYQEINFTKGIILKEINEIEELYEKLKTSKLFAFDIITDNKSYDSDITGISVATGNSLEMINNRLNVNNNKTELNSYYILIKNEGILSFDKIEKLNLIKEIFEDSSIAKISDDLKFKLHILKNNNIRPKNMIFDISLADYVVDSSLNHTLARQTLSYLKQIVPDEIEIFGKGKTQKNASSVEVETLANYMNLRAQAIYELSKYHQSNFDKTLNYLFYEIELPLTFMLFEMEENGVSIDIKYLKELSNKLTLDIEKIQQQIYQIAECEFNINSPSQVGKILFEKMGIMPKGKTKGKSGFSTSAEVLEELALEEEIAKLILDYRGLMKIKTTYVDTLPELVSKKDNRIHTTFNQTVTTTGRLSSSNPNLQNIPIRTELGNSIREAFIPQDKQNYVLVAADYSQIELRLLAHFSQDEILISAFRNNEDIHTATASKVFSVPKEEITKEMRRKAKAVNFGIVYGQTRYGLAQSLGISSNEAQSFIDKYFENYPKIKLYMEGTALFANENMYVQTMFGRKRYFTNELNSSNHNIREFAKRAAINAPLQGTAADLMKIVMIKLAKSLKENNIDGKIIMQVHDELVFEVNKRDLEKLISLTKDIMENTQTFAVPLVVDIGYGMNWKETKLNEI